RPVRPDAGAHAADRWRRGHRAFHGPRHAQPALRRAAKVTAPRITSNAGPKRLAGPPLSCAPMTSTSADPLAQLAGDYWEFRLRESRALALELDDRRYRRELFRESIEDYARRDREAGSFLKRLEALPRTQAGVDELTPRLMRR